MNSKPNNIIIPNSDNERQNQKKIISLNIVDLFNIPESQINKNNKKLTKEENKDININESVNNYNISTFKKEDWNQPTKIYTKEEIVNKMNLIFLNYAIYYTKKNIYLISIENLIKIVRKSGVLPNLIKLYELDIIIKLICPKTKFLTFEDLMSIFMKIAYKIYPKEIKSNKDLLLNHFFNNIFSSYSDILSEEPMPLNDILKYPYSSILSLLNIIPEDSQILVINSLLYTLNEIYEKYFVYNTKLNPSFNNKNLSNLYDFCKDFEIIPFIFNETQLVNYFNLVIDKKDLFKLIDDSSDKQEIKDKKNGLFSFNNFILFFIHLSEYNHAKIYKNYITHEKGETKLSKLIMILTKLECSKGMRQMVKKSLPNLSLMPNKELLLKYNFIFKKEDKGTFDNLIDIKKNFEENLINNGNNDEIQNYDENMDDNKEYNNQVNI